jgi:hypothetical protein
MPREPSLLALFSTQAEAEAGVNELAAAGFGADEIGFLAPGDAGEPNTGRNEAVGIGSGLALGAAAGALLGAASVGAVTGLGLVLAAGTLVPIVVGGATGSAAGATAGALFAAAVTQDEGLYYQQEVQGGRSLVSVTTSRADEAWAALERAHPREIANVGAGGTARRLGED